MTSPPCFTLTSTSLELNQKAPRGQSAPRLPWSAHHEVAGWLSRLMLFVSRCLDSTESDEPHVSPSSKHVASCGPRGRRDYRYASAQNHGK